MMVTLAPVTVFISGNPFIPEVIATLLPFSPLPATVIELFERVTEISSYTEGISVHISNSGQPIKLWVKLHQREYLLYAKLTFEKASATPI